ncbi:barstar family protein [Paludibacterium yongneupense]|uniref:barstar family protein n=1 Tax=Paludibacterium yongneupense TaxID=400061 RepID=UPI00041055C0|nr:barstar family protein [Paludibacterium yongneupense]
MRIRSCELRHIRSLDMLLEQLTLQLPLPGGQVYSLDALYDALRHGVVGPFEIYWRDTDIARQGLGIDLYASILEILETIARERGDVTLDIHH